MIEVQIIGPSQTIVEVVYKKRNIHLFYFYSVWLLLFFGSMLTIMNFHEDVSMQRCTSKDCIQSLQGKVMRNH